MHTATLTNSRQLLDGTETQSSFLQGDAFRQFCPLSLYILPEHQASLHRPQIAVSCIAQSGKEILWGVDLARGILSSVNGLTLLT